jgi:hypothetical protein
MQAEDLGIPACGVAKSSAPEAAEILTAQVENFKLYLAKDPASPCSRGPFHDK